VLNPTLTEEKVYPMVLLQQKAEKLRKEGRDIVDLTIGDPEDNTVDSVRLSIIESMNTQNTCRYPCSNGTIQLRRAISDWAYRNYAITLDPDQHVLSANGTKEAIFGLALCFDFLDREIFIPGLSYPVFAASARILDRPFRFLSISQATGFLPDLESISPSDWQKCRVFWINSPHNPTTAIASHNYLAKLLDLAQHYGFMVASDECYSDLYFHQKPASCMDFPDSTHWIVFRSLSKRSHMTGFRTGAVISRNGPLLSLFKKIRIPMGVGTPTFIQQAAIEAWKDDTHSRQNQAMYAAKRAQLLPRLRQIGLQVFGAEAGFYFWCSHPDFRSSDALSDWFLEKGLLVSPGTAFGSDGDGFVRLVYCITNDRINQVMDRLT